MSVQNPVVVGPLSVVQGRFPALIRGPCVMELDDLTQRIADALMKIYTEVGVPLIFKASFDKANRGMK